MRWLYITMVAIPTLLGMLTTLLILSVVIGPPAVIIGGKNPAYLLVDPPDFLKEGNSVIAILRLHNTGDKGLYVLRVLVNNQAKFTSETYLGPRESREISFEIGRIRGSTLNITIVWAPAEGGGLMSNTILVPAPTG